MTHTIYNYRYVRPCCMAQVDQTQKYSSLLAQRLGTGAEEVLALPPPQATPKPAQSEAQPSAPSSSQLALVKAEAATHEEDGPILALANKADTDMAEPNGSAVAPAQAQGVQVMDLKHTVLSVAAREYSKPTMPASIVQSRMLLDCGLSIRCRYRLSDTDVLLQAGTYVASPALADDMDVSEESEADSPHAAQPGSFSRRARSGLAALGQDQQAGEDDADDFRADSGSEEEDDEATLEEEEVGTCQERRLRMKCVAALS